MRTLQTILAVGTAVAAALLLTPSRSSRAQAKPPGRISLMETLSEWKSL